MGGELQHRGPDGTGLYRDGRLGLVNTRLSIVDLEGGDQPISNEDGRYWVMQNGEIYNAPELRAELGAHGHRFTTHCDTEVLVHAFEEWGTGCLDHLNGAFAFTVWDRKTRELFIARDRFGIRPLFLTEIEGATLFASEAKALLRHPKARRTLDPLGIAETFTLWANAPDRSALEGIRELAPGHFMRIGPEGVLEEACWWDLHFAHPDDHRTEDEASLAEELRDLLEDSTRLRLRADVPVGAYLSGGLDSSATAALVRRITTRGLSSFAVSFDDPVFDESIFQQQMAQELGTDLDAIKVAGPEIAEVFPHVIWLAEKPMLRTAPAPLYLLSKRVHEMGIKVVLTGEGADEVFAGYNIFRENNVRRFWARQPESEYRPLLLRRLYPYLAQDMGRAFGTMKAFFGRGLTDIDNPLYSHQIRFDNTSRCMRFLTTKQREHMAALGDPKERLRARLPAAFNGFSPLGKAQYLEIVTFMEGYLLHSQGDRMLMGNSVEGRFPFLDHRLAEFAARVPDRLRLRGLREKYLLRKAVSPLLPEEIGKREKRPYRAPILRAFIGPKSPDYVEEILSERSLTDAGFFEPATVAKLIDKCKRNLEGGVSETDEMALVGTLSTMLLHEAYVKNPIHKPPAKATREVVGAEVISILDT